MCGIAGIINFDGASVSPPILKRMTDAIIHRGPDGEGHWIENNIGFGHRRLAIIDPSPLGHQPMLSADSRYILSYNGEIYNFKELRVELATAGFQFHSQTDTEVVLNALIHWGVKALDRFNGMFAFALWDRKEQKLLLARDRYGIKPLYYAKWGSVLLFGSEQKAILEHPCAHREPDMEALLEYFTFQNIFTDKTLLKNIKLLPAGHYINLSLADKHNTHGSDNELKQIQYWDYHFREPEHRASDREYKEELDRLFAQAVNRQLVADVELGSYLSGGMDSGSITAVASQSFPNLKTFTCGFDLSSASGLELAFDERVNAEAMSYRFKTEHYEMVLKAGDMERCLPSLAWHLEEPRVGQSYPNYYMAQLAGKFVKVVLSGAGGDELFAGYPWRYYRAVVNDDFDHYIEKYYSYWQRMVSNNDLKKMFAPVWNDVKDVNTRDIFRDVFVTRPEELGTPEEYINHSLYFEAKTFLHGLFVVEDKLSMAHSLETRVPFMDNDLVDFAMQCPINLKLNNLTDVMRINENEPGDKQAHFFQKTNDGKQILRNAMEQYIPKTITEGEKKGFSAPDASWFKGESIDFVKRRLLNKNAAIYDYMDQNIVEQLVNEHLNGSENKRLLIWSLLNVDECLRRV